MKKFLLLCLLSGAFALLHSCTPIEELKKGVPPTPELPVPTKAPEPTAARQVVLYYPSYARYSGITAESILAKAGPNDDYAHDVFVPSFCVIGDGKTSNGSETSAWKKNQIAFDDIYAWGGLNWDSNGYLTFSNGASIGEGNIASGLNKYPTVPYGIAIGGWPKNDDVNDPLRTGGFDRLGVSSIDLDEFVKSIDELSEIRRITRVANSLHIDYEFPETAFQAAGLLKIVKAIYAKVGNKYTINIALGPNIDKHLSHLDFSQLVNYVHSFEVMTYDFNGRWSSTTGHHTPLYSNTNIPQDNANFSANFSADAEVNYLISKGVPASKIKIGVALYGRFWTNVDFPTTIDPTKPYFSTGIQADPTDAPEFAYGVIKYNKILNLTTANGWEFYNDTNSKAPFIIHRAKKIFITYDNVASIQEKASYVKTKGLGGILVWDATGAVGTTVLKDLHLALQ